MQVYRLTGKPSGFGVMAVVAAWPGGLARVGAATARSAAGACRAAPPAAPQAPAAPQQGKQAAPGLVFGADAGIIINTIKADKGRLPRRSWARSRRRCRRAENPVRKQQATGMEVFKAVEPGPPATALYFFIMGPGREGRRLRDGEDPDGSVPVRARALWTS